jgi:para-aminobenzoate synthetase/4-amino-4-deoxychorismate lyase
LDISIGEIMAGVREQSERIEAIVQIGPDRWIACADPERVIAAQTADHVSSALADVERLTRDFGLHAVGFVTYEAGAAFGLRVRPAPAGLPLVWFALFAPASVRPVGRPRAEQDYRLGATVPTIRREQFHEAFAEIKRRVADGDTYQVNFTFGMVASFEGDPRSFFADLIDAQRGEYSLYLSMGDRVACSASPELFFALEGVDVQTRPMKGTARRGLTLADDRQRREELRASPKERAENVMIVDMMRNDLGRVAEVGSVAVPELFAVERYPTVWQMTSRVTARSTASLVDLFAALHPSASVTGAPKVRTMEIVSELEPAPRGIYTGAIGYVPPDGNARFNVAIRTAIVDRRQQTVTFGVGSGIVWDSNVDAEYDECLLKGTVLGRRPLSFDLLETLRWTPAGGFFLLERHLARLSESAEFFGVSCSDDDVRRALRGAVEGQDQARRVRLLVGQAGEIRVEHQPFVPNPATLRVKMAAAAVDAGDVWLFHKTTRRAVYEEARAAVADVDEVLLWNGDRQLTEAATANVVVELDGERVTPPVTCGLLAGTFRAELLARGEIREKVVRVEDLRWATGLWLINSVHEWRQANLVW